MNPEQARDLLLSHRKLVGAAAPQHYDTQAAIEAIGLLTAFIEAEPRRYADHYSEGTDGRNTFVMFANMISNLTAERVKNGIT